MSLLRAKGWYVYGDGGERIHIWTSEPAGNDNQAARNTVFKAGVAMPEPLFDEMCDNWLRQRVPSTIEPAQQHWIETLSRVRADLDKTAKVDKDVRLAVFSIDNLLHKLDPDYRADLSLYAPSEVIPRRSQ